jgi:hypothetical protein
MTNHEILTTPRDMLGEVDRQCQLLLQVEATPMPCPACKKPVNAFQAAGITLEEYTTSARPATPTAAPPVPPRWSRWCPSSPAVS